MGKGFGLCAVFLIALALFAASGQADTMAETSKLWSRLQAGSIASFLIDNENIPFTSITFSLKEMTENVDIEINVLSSNDTFIESQAPETLYKYVRAIPTQIQVSNMENAKIDFRVPLSWLSDNLVNKGTLSLYKYDSGVWSRLETSLIREDDYYTYYESGVEKFVFFAISGDIDPSQRLCTPGEGKCTANDVYRCSSSGLEWSHAESCAYGCDSSAGACRPDLSCPACPSASECPAEGAGCPECQQCPAIPECPKQQPCPPVPAQGQNDTLYLAVIAILLIALAALAIYAKSR